MPKVKYNIFAHLSKVVFFLANLDVPVEGKGLIIQTSLGKDQPELPALVMLFR